MDHKDLEFFRNLLNQMLEEAQQKGDSTLEEMTDSNEVFADPADRATAESDRSFTLRIRDRERRLIRKIQSALQRIEDGSYGICEECGEEIGVPRLKAPPCHPTLHQLQSQAGRRRDPARRLTSRAAAENGGRPFFSGRPPERRSAQSTRRR